MRESQPFLAAKELEWRVDGRSVLGPVNLTIERGDCAVVVGPNGAGKTTLLRLLAGLLGASGGEVQLEGVALSSLPARSRARRIAYLPQQRPLRVPLTVYDLVVLARYAYRRGLGRAPRAADLAAAREALERTALSHLAPRRLEELSGGERQRAYLAAALAQGGDLWLLDEPTTHLDARHQLEIAALLADLHAQGRTLVVATHDLNLAARLATRVVALVDGEVRGDGPAGELLTRESLAAVFGAPFAVISLPHGTHVALEL